MNEILEYLGTRAPDLCVLAGVVWLFLRHLDAQATHIRALASEGFEALRKNTEAIRQLRDELARDV